MPSEVNDAPWWWGTDNERFYGPFRTREEAMDEARENLYGGGFYLVQATQYAPLKLSGYFDAERMIENAEDDACEYTDPEGDITLFDVGKSEMNDLQAMVRSTIDAWQEKHGLVFQPWRFATQGESEWVKEEDGADA